MWEEGVRIYGIPRVHSNFSSNSEMYNIKCVNLKFWWIKNYDTKQEEKKNASYY